MEQTKVIQEVVLPEVSKLNHAVMNKKRRRSERTDQKNEMDSNGR